jgi:hypothetical protein
LNVCISSADHQCLVGGVGCDCTEFPLVYKNSSGHCVPTHICSSTEYMAVPPTHSTDRVCLPHAVCTITLDTPTSTTPGTCSNCTPHTQWYDRKTGICWPCTQCSLMEVRCGVDNDNICGVCGADSFILNGECEHTTRCDRDSEYVAVPQTPTTDVVCVQCTANCSTGERFVKQCSGLRDNACLPCPEFQHMERSIHRSEQCVPDTHYCAQSSTRVNGSTTCPVHRPPVDSVLAPSYTLYLSVPFMLLYPIFAMSWHYGSITKSHTAHVVGGVVLIGGMIGGTTLWLMNE